MHEGLENKIQNGVINEVINFSDNEIKIMSLIKENKKITKKELEKKTHLSKSTIDRTISNLKEKNILKRIGANKNGYWKIVK